MLFQPYSTCIPVIYVSQRPSQNPKPTKRKRTQTGKRTQVPPPTADNPRQSPPKSWQLPLEILYMILYVFWTTRNIKCSDVEAIQSFSTTCVHWHAAARPYIFRFITLDSVDKFDTFSRQLRADPSVAQWVRKVRLVGKSQPYTDDIREHRDNIEQDIDQWFYRFPEGLNPQFSSLRVFELVISLKLVLG